MSQEYAHPTPSEIQYWAMLHDAAQKLRHASIASVEAALATLYWETVGIQHATPDIYTDECGERVVSCAQAVASAMKEYRLFTRHLESVENSMRNAGVEGTA